MKYSLVTAFAVLALAGSSHADEAIKNVMKNAFKGDTSLFNTVSKGKGTEADAQRLAAYIKALPDGEPPRGTKQAWERRTKELLTAAESLAKGNKQAMMALQRAGTCKACHSAHKED